MREWPKTINIMGKVYTVIIAADPNCRDDGIIDEENATIKLFNGNKSPAEIMYVLLHEITHGVSTNLGEDFSESFVERWARAYADTLIRNNLVDLPTESKLNVKKTKTHKK
jgi:hypothetical protein